MISPARERQCMLCQCFLLLILCCGATCANAATAAMSMTVKKSVIGAVYPIAETNMLDWIRHQLAVPQVQHRLQAALQRAVANVLAATPASQPVLPKTTRVRQWTITPAVARPAMRRDSELREHVRTQSFVNPLAVAPFSWRLVFYNGEDAAQVTWVKTRGSKPHPKDLLVAVQGSLAQQRNLLQRAVYDDSDHFFLRYFHITHLPAVVFAAGQRFVVQEVVP